MKPQSNIPESHFPARRRVIAAGVLALCSAAVAVPQLWTPEEFLADTSIHLPLDEILKFPDFGNARAFEWSAFSIENPAQANEMIEAVKSPEDKIRDEWKNLAILDPEGYCPLC